MKRATSVDGPIKPVEGGSVDVHTVQPQQFALPLSDQRARIKQSRQERGVKVNDRQSTGGFVFAHRRRVNKIGLGHPQWFQDVLADVGLIRFPGNRFDYHAQQHVVEISIHRLLPGFELQLLEIG
jgi:hypothetical protein